MWEISTGGGLGRRGRFPAWGVVLALAVCGLLLVPPPNSVAATGFITGTVTDASTAEGLGQINVCAYLSNGPSHCAMTESDGEYTIGNLTTASYKLGFVSVDHVYLTQFYSGKKSFAEADPVPVTEGMTTSNIDVAMQEGGKITGEVTAAFDGMPIGGIKACVHQAIGPGRYLHCEETDPNGDYTIPGLAEGSYKLEFFPGLHCACEPQHYVTQFYSGKNSWTEADAVAVTVGATTTGIDVELVSVRTLTVSLAGTGSGTVISSPAGIDCGSNCSDGFPRGSSVVLAPVPVEGSSFAGWTGGCSGTGVCQVTLDDDTAVGATFELAGGGDTPGGGETPGGGDSGTPGTIPPPAPAPTPIPGPKPKKLKCKKGFKKKKVRGKARCVRIKKHHRKHAQTRKHR